MQVFAIEFNGSAMPIGLDAGEAWREFQIMVETMIEGDELILWIGDKIAKIETKFFSPIPVDAPVF